MGYALLKEEELERTEEYVNPLSNTNWFEAVISSAKDITQTPKIQRLFSHNAISSAPTLPAECIKQQSSSKTSLLDLKHQTNVIR